MFTSRRNLFILSSLLCLNKTATSCMSTAMPTSISSSASASMASSIPSSMYTSTSGPIPSSVFASMPSSRSTSMSSCVRTSMTSGVTRLGPITGYQGRRNSVVYVAPRQPPKEGSGVEVLVFFPGDIQNYPEVMLGVPEAAPWVCRNLEAVGAAIARSCPHKHVLVVKPSRTERGVFNCYDNFVASNDFGAPDFLSSQHTAWQHLNALLNNVLRIVVDGKPKGTEGQNLMKVTEEVAGGCLENMEGQVKCEEKKDEEERMEGKGHNLKETIESEHHDDVGQQYSSPKLSQAQDLLQKEPDTSIHISSSESARLDEQSECSESKTESRTESVDESSLENEVDIASVSLVGFSKGCVVLNELVKEIYMLPNLPEDERNSCSQLMQKVDEMAWLDGGHSGREGTWITNPNFVKRLVNLNPRISVTVHVTPYQMSDRARPWIGNECRSFVQLCRQYAPATRAPTARVPALYYRLHGEHDDPPTLATHFKALDAYGVDEDEDGGSN